MGVGDPFEHDDAAYLLGVLPAPERAAYEQHLATCAVCRARVESLRPITDGLGRLQEQDVANVSGVADDRPDAGQELPRLLDAFARQRRRRVWAMRGLGGLAAAAIAALIVVVSVPGSPAPGRSTPAAAHAMTALVPTPVTAEVSLRRAAWGTEVQVQCRYLTVSAYPGARAYDLVVVDRAGHRHVLGSWTLSAGNKANFSSPVALSRDAIRLVQVTRADGTPILQLAP